MKLIEKINKIHKEMGKLELEIQKLEKLSKKFPDLMIDRGRYGHEFYVSKSVNAMAEEAGIYDLCSCCEDSGVVAAPYVQYEGFTIYSIPREVYVGDKCPFSRGRVNPSNTWEEDLKSHGFSKKVIEDARTYFEEHDFDDYDDEDAY